MIGKRALDDPRNGLLLQFLRLVVELDADYFVFENVKGLTVGKHRKLLQELIDAFAEDGYAMFLPYQVLNAADFGVPQDRRRVFLMGGKKGLQLPQYPKPSAKRTTVWQAIGDLPNPEDYPELLDRDAVGHGHYGKGSPYARVLRGQAHDPGDFSHPRKWSPRWLTSSMRTVHTPASQSRFEATAHGKVEAVSRFLKLDPEGLCNTLRAGTGSDRGAFTSPRPIHPHAPRVITVREAARLHSYPDWFRFHSTKWHGFREIGNSVPPLLGRAVAKELIVAMNVATIRPKKSLELGDEGLLTMKANDAVEHYGISDYVPGRRIRISTEEDRQAVGAVAV
jgi:DNA (cytosine-5)-methyltransferase 1